MTSKPKIAINPFPWFADGPDNWNLTAVTVAEAVDGISDAGFTAMQADLPSGMTPDEFAALLAVRNVRPAPSYWGIFLDSAQDAVPGLHEEAKQRAAAQRAIGVSGIVIADELYPARIARPGAGADFRQDRLDRVIERVADIASVLVAEGLMPFFHPHVASWIETDAEVRALLDAIDPAILSFGPDIAHLSWAGADPARLIADYASRVGLIHLKDFHSAAAQRVREDNLTYDDAVYNNHVFTEPGRGDVDFDAVLAAVPATYDGWWVAEVDVPDLATKEQSTAACAHWMIERISGAELAPA